MKVLTLKDLPDGRTLAGTVVDLPDDVVAVLSMPGVDSVRPVTDEDEADHAPRRRGYVRRDLRAAS
jgi:hypothetical protein